MNNFTHDHIRWLVLVLLVAVLAAMIASFIVGRSTTPRRVRRILMWFFLFLLNVCYGVGSNLKDGIRVNYPVYFNACILLGLLCAIIWHPRGDDRLPNQDGAVTSRFVLWLDDRIRRHKERTRSN